MGPALQPPSVMTVAEFLAWNAPPGTRWQLLDGEPVAMAPTSRTHGALQGELGGMIRDHLRATGSDCSLIVAPGIIPRIRADENFRVPDLGVTCTAYESEEYDVANPILLVEILSPSNRADTWRNVWAYTTIPGLREILILSSTAIRADLLRRDGEGQWPARPLVIETGDLTLETIGLTVPLASLYRTTRLAQG